MEILKVVSLYIVMETKLILNKDFQMLKIYFLVLLINTFALSTLVNASSSLKIIDGDTIILNAEKIRFYGIDTPEKKTNMY